MTWAAVGTYIAANAGYFAAASAVVGVVSAAASADSQRKAAHYNADVAEQQGIAARQQGAANEDAQRRRGAIAVGAAAAAASGGSGLSGTNSDLIEQSSTNAEMDALNIRYGSTLSGQSADARGQMANSAADNATRSGYLNAGAAMLSSAGNYGQGQARIKAPAGGGGG